MTFQLLHIYTRVLYVLFVFFIHPFGAFQCNCALQVKYYYFIYCYCYYHCAQFVNNCLQSYNELCACGNLMRNTHSIGNT